jgi:hypothetical protein
MCKLSIYRDERGSSFEKTASIWPLREIWRTRVHSDVPRVTFFYQNSRVFVESDLGVNPLPQGASFGELGKNLTPSKRRVCQNSLDKFANHPWTRTPVSWKWNIH